MKIKNSFHGNSNQNARDHHLYEIYDRELGEIFKFGISSESIESDGLSKRIKIQTKVLNLGAGWLRYFGEIIQTKIKGRQKAKELESHRIEDYTKANGRKPRGNQ